MKIPSLFPEPDDFHLRRRQQLMYSALYKNCRELQLSMIQVERENVFTIVAEAARGYGHQSHVACQAFVYHESFWLWMLDYTAGEDLDVLAPRLTAVVDEFVQWNEVNKPYRLRLREEFPDRNVDLTISAVDFDNQIWYEDALQLVSVAIMLRDARSVKRIIRAMDSNRGADALYEELIRGYVEEPWHVDEALHDEPYPTLLQAFEAPDPIQGLPFVQTYLKNWYKAQDGARWYNGHQKRFCANLSG